MTRKKISMSAPKGYFEFSKMVKSVDDLKFWIGWFKQKDIKTGIIGIEGQYILCVEGVEA